MLQYLKQNNIRLCHMETQQTTLHPELESELRSPSMEESSTTVSKAAKLRLATSPIDELLDRIATLLSSERVEDSVLDEVNKIQSAVRRRLFEINASQTVKPEDVEAAALQEARLGDLSKTIREHERRRAAERTALFEDNKAKAVNILEGIKSLLDTGEDFGVVYAEFHRLKDEWLAARPLDSQDEAVLRKTFVELRDQFYELKAINEELREYDYRKNLEAKRSIIQELEQLIKGQDIVSIYQSVLVLVEQWHELGPVSKDLRLEINAQFKALTTEVYRRHQAYHDERKVREEKNLEAKTKLCEEAERLSSLELDSYAKWEEVSEQLKSLQQQWRKIGYATKKENDRIYQRFRHTLDQFYSKWKSYTNELHRQRKECNERKEQLVEEAKLISESNDWDAGVKRIKQIQKEWKELNAPSIRASHKLWVELRKHIDKFFERKAAANVLRTNTYEQNLVAKRAIIEKLEALKAETDLSLLRKELDRLAKEWKEIGYVVGRLKDEINGSYKASMDELYGKLRNSREQRRLQGYSNKIEQVAQQEGGVQHEIRRLQYALDKARTELQTYENNLGFLNLDSKGGAGLLKVVERKREQLAQEISLMQEKMALLRAKL